ncbi:MAG TPA: hemolysin III family protein [Chloroflexota bacterium]
MTGCAPDGSPSVAPAVRPRLRGTSHLLAFGASLLTGPLLLAVAPSGAARLATGVYALSLSALFGVSALYHRCTWTPAKRRWLRRLDHAMIFLLIAGTYTAIAGLALPRSTALPILLVVWCGALVGAALQFVSGHGARWLAVGPYVALGWTAVAVLPQLLEQLGYAGFGLLLGGAVLYTVGAFVYARRRPDPRPAVFGYHEVFHLLVIGAAAAHYATVVGVVLPRL